MENFFPLTIMISHTFIGVYFVFFGFWNIYHWRPLIEMMAQKNIPHPWLLLPIGITWQVVCGFLIILGIYVKLAALLLIPFTLISICIFHPFWQFRGELRNLNLIIFIGNLTVTIAALLFLINNVTPLLQLIDLFHMI
jgi:putative oxidoreductase